MSTPLLTSSPAFGACLSEQSVGDQLCAVGVISCPDGYDYRRDSLLTEFQKCKSPYDVGIGSCRDTGRCSATPGACSSLGEYQEPTPPNIVCSLVGTSPQDPTLYPTCQPLNDSTGPRCVFSIEQCRNGEEVGIPPSDSSSLTCRCTDVPTGLCYTPRANPDGTSGIDLNDLFCAMTANDCEPFQTFMEAYDLLNFPNQPIVCRLCAGDDVFLPSTDAPTANTRPTTLPAPVAPPPPPTPSPTPRPFIPIVTARPTPISTTEGDGTCNNLFGMGFISGVIFTSLLQGLLYLLFSCWYERRKRRFEGHKDGIHAVRDDEDRHDDDENNELQLYDYENEEFVDEEEERSIYEDVMLHPEIT